MQVDLCEKSNRYFLKYFLVTQDYITPSNRPRGGVEVLTDGHWRGGAQIG